MWIAKNTNVGRLGRTICQRLKEQGSAFARSKGGDTAYIAVKAGISAARNMGELQDHEGRQLVMQMAWSRISFTDPKGKTADSLALLACYRFAAIGSSRPTKPILAQREGSHIQVLTIGANTSTTRLAGSVKVCVQERGEVILQTIGAEATGQALKATILAEKYMREDGHIGALLAILPEMAVAEVDGFEESRVMRLRCFLLEPGEIGRAHV